MAHSEYGGHDGPYDAPIQTGRQTVLTDWIDYNGHMNVAYYTLAFDRAIDAFFSDVLGIGADYVAAERQGPYAMQAHYQYFAELLEGEGFDTSVILHDCDAKRMHLVLQISAASDGRAVALLETISLNVDLNARKSTPYPAWVLARLMALKAAHDGIERPPQMGASLGLKRS
jgi:acyl-CoA thioester hydrolase